MKGLKELWFSRYQHREIAWAIANEMLRGDKDG